MTRRYRQRAQLHNITRGEDPEVTFEHGEVQLLVCCADCGNMVRVLSLEEEEVEEFRFCPSVPKDGCTGCEWDTEKLIDHMLKVADLHEVKGDIGYECWPSGDPFPAAWEIKREEG